MPPVMHGGVLFPRKFLGVDRDDFLDHDDGRLRMRWRETLRTGLALKDALNEHWLGTFLGSRTMMCSSSKLWEDTTRGRKTLMEGRKIFRFAITPLRSRFEILFWSHFSYCDVIMKWHFLWRQIGINQSMLLVALSILWRHRLWWLIFSDEFHRFFILPQHARNFSRSILGLTPTHPPLDHHRTYYHCCHKFDKKKIYKSRLRRQAWRSILISSFLPPLTLMQPNTLLHQPMALTVSCCELMLFVEASELFLQICKHIIAILLVLSYRVPRPFFF